MRPERSSHIVHSKLDRLVFSSCHLLDGGYIQLNEQQPRRVPVRVLPAVRHDRSSEGRYHLRSLRHHHLQLDGSLEK